MKNKLKEKYLSNPIPEILEDSLFFEMQRNHLIDTDWLRKYLIRREYHFLSYEKNIRPHKVYEILSMKWLLSFHTIAGYIRSERILYTENSFWDNFTKSDNIVILTFAKIMKYYGVKIYK